MERNNGIALPRGIITVLNTPYNRNGTIDYGALTDHVHYACQAGVSGFLVPAMASENGMLSQAEKIEMVACVLDAAAPEIEVIGGAGGSDAYSCKQMTKAFLQTGCRHILYQFPFKNAETFKRLVYEVADAGCQNIVLQDWESNGYGIPDDLILELFESVDAFKGIKIETVPAGIKYSRILALTGGALHVSGGWAVAQMMEGLIRGVHAFMPTGLHYVYTEIYRNFHSGKRKEAESLFYRLLPILSFSNQHLDISIHFFKRLLARQGLYKTASVRNAGIGFDRIHEDIADQLIDMAIALENEIQKKRNT